MSSARGPEAEAEAEARGAAAGETEARAAADFRIADEAGAVYMVCQPVDITAGITVRGVKPGELAGLGGGA